MNSNNIPVGLSVPSQLPLDVKLHSASQAVLSNLGTNNNLAFTYYQGMIVYCVAEKTRWEWREVGGTGTKLLTTDFTYPANLVVGGITYSNKIYNFYQLETVQGAIQNIGVASEPIYKGFNSANNKHEFRGIKDSLSIDVSSDSTDVSLEIKEIAENVGTEGTTVYKEFDLATKKHRFKKIKTTNLVITEVDGSINIDTPVDENNRSFYVDQAWNGTQKGTLAQPFKTLNKAITAFIGAGTWIYPQFEGYKITLLSSVELYEGNGVDYVGMNNLDVNTLNIVGNGNYLTLRANPSVDYYPISSRRMVATMTGGNNVILSKGIYMRFKDLTLQRVGTSAIVDNFNYSYPKVTDVSGLSPLQPIVDLGFENVVFTNDSELDAPAPGSGWETVPDPNNGGADAVFFGSKIYVSDTIPVPLAPMLKTEGYGWNKEGYLQLKDILMTNSLGTYIYAKETTFSFQKVNFARNQTRILYDDFIAGVYTPKSNQYYIEIKDCKYTQLFTEGPKTIPSVAVSLGGNTEPIGGSDAWLKITGSHCFIRSADIEGAYNNIIKSDGYVDVSINQMLARGSISREVHGFHKIEAPLPPSKLSISVYSSNIVDVKAIPTGPGLGSDLSYLGAVYGFSNVINLYDHDNSGANRYIDNDEAKAAGLFEGMVYANSSTGVLSRVY